MYCTCTDCKSIHLFFFYSFTFIIQDARKKINKYLPEQFRELALWSIALLVNSLTWTEFKHNWKLICLVFLQLHLGEEHIDQVHQDRVNP